MSVLRHFKRRIFLFAQIKQQRDTIKTLVAAIFIVKAKTRNES